MATVPKLKRRKVRSLRRIETIYYFRKSVVKRNKSKYANSAVKNCTDHMQMNKYHATHAEVYDTETGEPHAVITCRLKGGKLVIETLFEREIEGRLNE